MPAPSGFVLERRKNGDVVVTHHGRVASVLRGRAAEKLSSAVDRAVDRADELGAQHAMARATGNYKRGNERNAR